MRLLKIFDKVNQIEKSSFLKVVDNLSNENRRSNKAINAILSQHDGQIKQIDDADIVKLFQLTKEDFAKTIDEKLQYNTFQLDVLIDILIRDGNSIMSREWFAKLYEDEIAQLKASIETFMPRLDDDNRDISSDRKRDYVTYLSCIKTAYENDEVQNREKLVTRDEKTILDTLAQNLELSLQEQRIIYHSIVGIKKIDIDTIINSLKEVGIIFYHRKSYSLFIPDEIVWILRDLVGTELPNKYFRRILRLLKDTEINRITRKHLIDGKLNRAEKIDQILKQGVSVKSTLLHDIFKDGTTKTEKKAYLQELAQKKLVISLNRLGTTPEERVDILLEYFRNLDEDDNIGMSTNGFEKLLVDMKSAFPSLSKKVRKEFQIQEETVMQVDVLKDYNIKPLDVLDLISNVKLAQFCQTSNIKKGNNIRLGILKNYKDTGNLLLENYSLIGKRDLNALKEKGIIIKEAELGIKYEDLTKRIFTELGYNVDEKLRKQLNTKKNKMDVVLNLGGSEVIVVECKTIKNGMYTKYSSVSRQLKSYLNLCEVSGHKVVRIILVADNFSDDFINDCEYDLDINLSLVTSSGLLKIMDAFKQSSRKAFPTKLLQKEGKLNNDRIVQALLGKSATSRT